MLSLLVPILVSFLLDPSQTKASSKQLIQLSDHSLQWLMKIGPKYPQVTEISRFSKNFY
jgi:HEAT repeat-containing protein 5